MNSAGLPQSVRRLVGVRGFRVVWENEAGGISVEVGEGGGDRFFLKWSPASGGVDLQAEVDRLRWAVKYTPVPRVLDYGQDEEGSWMMTAPLPGSNAVSDRWKAAPSTAVEAIACGLRAFHDALPVEECPFTWSVSERLARAQERLQRRGMTGWHPIHQSLGLDEALAILSEPPAIDRWVVCHGDTCAPNTLIAPDGRWSGHVDLGSLGVADRWADLAIAAWSLEWNYGVGWEDRFFEIYGTAPDAERIRYYRLLWDVAD